jgi:CBS domain
LHGSEAGTERRRSWWLRGLTENETIAAEYIKAHSRKVADIMVRHVIIADSETPLDEIATLMEQNSIKRVPIVSEGQLVGIVTRANVIQAVASNNIGLELKGRGNSRKAAGRFEGTAVGSYGAVECHRNWWIGASLGNDVFRNRKTSNLRGC